MKKLVSLLLLLSILALSLLSCGTASDYREAKALIKKGELEAAYALLLSLGDYKDAEELLARFTYVPVEGSFTSFSAEGKELLGYDHEFTYDENGRPVHYCSGSNATSYIYDEKGNLLEERFTNAHYTYLTAYAYDEHGNRIRMSRGASGKVEYYEEYTYDENGNLLTEVHFYADSTDLHLPIEPTLRQQEAYAYAYDESGRVIREERTYKENKQVWEYLYDDAGLLLEDRYTVGGKTVVTAHVYDEAGRILRSSSTKKQVDYTYDEQGNLIKKESRTATPEGYTRLEIDTYEYTYDERGNVIKRVEKLSGGKPHVYEFVYDEQGSLLEQTITAQPLNSNNTLVQRERYDEHGNVIERSTTDSDGFKTVTAMTYKLVYLSPEKIALIRALFDPLL